MKKKEKSSESDKKSANSWFIFIAIITFVLSIISSFIAEKAVSELDIVKGIICLTIVILIGIIFDLIGVSVTIADEDNFHAKASKKIKGAKTSIKMIRNSARVSNFCADVVGDICGVLSGAISAMIAQKVTSLYGMDSNIQFIFSAVVASLTVCGKAITKEIAKKHSTEVLSFVSKFISIKEK